MKPYKNDLEELEYLRKRVCCLEECTEATAIDITEMPGTLAVDDTYTVNITYAGVTIPTVFENEETMPEVITALNEKFKDFKIVFSTTMIDDEKRLKANITVSNIACKMGITTVYTPAP